MSLEYFSSHCEYLEKETQIKIFLLNTAKENSLK